MLPLKLRLFCKVRAVVLSERKVVPSLSVNVPVPTGPLVITPLLAELLPSASVPALTVVPPL
jgi:hypothetical protein